MAAQVHSFRGSQDILFPEDAPAHYNVGSDSSVYSPPSSSTYSSYSQEVKYIFNPLQYTSGTPPSGTQQQQHNEYNEINSLDVVSNHSNSSTSSSKTRRRSYESSPRGGELLTLGHTQRTKMSPRGGELPPTPRGSTSSTSSYPASSPRPDPARQPLSAFKGSPRLESQGSTGSTGSARSTGSLRSTTAGSGHGVKDRGYPLPPAPPKPPRHEDKPPMGNSNNHQRISGCDVIPEQEIYSAPHGGQTTTPNTATRGAPAVRPPPYWSRAWVQNSARAQNGAAATASGENAGTATGSKGSASLFASRRKTWSPPTCSRVLSCANTFSTLRSYRSNDQLDVDEDQEENVYEDLDAVVAPPRIAPVSGFLNKVSRLPSITDEVVQDKNAQKSLIKPIAFKPIAAPHPGRYVPSPQHSVLPNRLTPPNRSHDLKLANHNHGSHDDGYASQEYTSGSHSHSTSNTSSNSSSYQVSDASMSFGSEHGKLLDRSASYGSSNASRLSSNQTEAYIQTPSPSDSGVGELETMLRDKDAEITHLRETMEHNETVIFQVYEEKRQNWAMQLKEVVAEWERRLRHHQQKSFKMEQALLLQLFKLQQERKNLRLDVEQLRAEKERSATRITSLEAENAALQRKLEEQQWETQQKAGEISLLKAQLKEAKEEASNKTNDLIGVRSQLKDVSGTKGEQEQERLRLQEEVARVTKDMSSMGAELEQLRRQVSRPKSDRLVQTEESRVSRTSPVTSQKSSTVSSKPSATTSSDLSVSESPAGAQGGSNVSTATASGSEQLTQSHAELLAMREQYELEKEQWLVEKNKVINYQKHLQLNYVQMYRKNKMLELEMEQLMVELENKDLTLSEKVSPQNPDGFESTC